MKRNRKKQRVNAILLPAPFVTVAVILSVAALAYIWLGLRYEAIAREVKSLEVAREDLAEHCRIESIQWTQMKSPENLEAALAEHNIRMTWPNTEQIVYLRRSELEPRGLVDEREEALRYARAALAAETRRNRPGSFQN